MSNTNCITGIPFSITGNLISFTREIDLAFTFNSSGDQASVKAFEWYIDGVLLLDQSLAAFSGAVACGSHTIGGRILTDEGWSGIQEVFIQACVQQRWYNSVQSQQFTRNDCGTDFLGTPVTYTVPAGTYVSVISQEDADQQALNDVAANGQNNANLYGSCLVPATLNYTITERESPNYVDVNMQIRDQGVVVRDLFTNDSDSFAIIAGHTLSVQVYSFTAPVAPDATINLIVKKNGVIIYNESIPADALPDHPDASLIFTDTVSPADVYDVTAQGFSAATINYTLAEQVGPYADVNLQLKNNGVDVLDVYSNSSGTLTAGYNDTLDFIAYVLLSTEGSAPEIYLTVKRDGVTIYDQSHSGNPGDSLTFTETAQSGAVYEVTAASTADTAGTAPYAYTRSGSFEKNNCASGLGSVETFSKTYYSAVSVADAQDKAANDTNFTVAGQLYANANGSCSTITGTLIQDNVTLLPFYWVGMGGYGNHYQYNLQIDLIAGDYPAYSLITTVIGNPQILPVQHINYNPVQSPPVAGALIMATSWNSGAIPDGIPDGSDGFAGARSLIVFVNVQKILTDYPQTGHIIYEVTLNETGTAFERTIRIGATYDKTGQDSNYFSRFVPGGDSSGEIADGLISTSESTVKIRFHIYKQSATTGTLTYELL